MQGFSLHPNAYATGQGSSLIRMLEEAWVRDQPAGSGTFYIVSGFGNYNGGVRFYEVFRDHVSKGGRVVAFFAGSSSQKLTSKQLAEELLGLGAEVHIVNRKRLLHAKCYGASAQDGERLVVSSGNFTGPGMGQNVEASLILDRATTRAMGFSWQDLVGALLGQRWDRHTLTLQDPNAPGWRLLYDEFAGGVVFDESEESTLVLTLGHADTVRIQAAPGTTAAKGTQYFWLSKDCYGLFPPLTIRNRRGRKATFSSLVTMHYMDLRVTDRRCRVTFEAENNLDFRLGTGPLRNMRIADVDDLAAVSRVADSAYELCIFKRDSPQDRQLRPYAITYIGHQGKRYGYISNDDFSQIIGARLPRDRRDGHVPHPALSLTAPPSSLAENDQHFLADRVPLMHVIPVIGLER
jgi:hypothetical protein